MSPPGMLCSLGLFVAAGLAEIGGGYLVWLWLREGRGLWVGIAGAAVLIAYGVVPTLQPAGFGRVYAAYGGSFIVLSLLWGWVFEGSMPDRWDVIGGVGLRGRGVHYHVCASRSLTTGGNPRLMDEPSGSQSIPVITRPPWPPCCYRKHIGGSPDLSGPRRKRGT